MNRVVVRGGGEFCSGGGTTPCCHSRYKGMTRERESERPRERESERRRPGWLLHLSNAWEGQLRASTHARDTARRTRRRQETEREREKGDVSGTVSTSHFQNSPNYFQICIRTSKSPKIKVAQNLKLYNFALGLNLQFQLFLKLDFQI
jgi:hypothetical protein